MGCRLTRETGSADVQRQLNVWCCMPTAAVAAVAGLEMPSLGHGSKVLREQLTWVPSSSVMNCANAMGSSLPPAAATFLPVPEADFFLGKVGWACLLGAILQCPILDKQTLQSSKLG